MLNKPNGTCNDLIAFLSTINSLFSYKLPPPTRIPEPYKFASCITCLFNPDNFFSPCASIVKILISLLISLSKDLIALLIAKFPTFKPKDRVVLYEILVYSLSRYCFIGEHLNQEKSFSRN